VPGKGEYFKLKSWWRQKFGQNCDELCTLACMLADIVPHAASPERVFSMMGWYQSKRRNRLGIKTVQSMAAIKLDQQAR
jgi:hAT family C-terminal dimerisation region